nr:MAG TPA: hypothetical protein [Caudoviricetes sp.]
MALAYGHTTSYCSCSSKNNGHPANTTQEVTK